MKTSCWPQYSKNGRIPASRCHVYKALAQNRTHRHLYFSFDKQLQTHKDCFKGKSEESSPYRFSLFQIGVRIHCFVENMGKKSIYLGYIGAN